MQKQHNKALTAQVRQAVECLTQYRGSFKELSLRSGKSKSFVSKWTKGIKNSDLLLELASVLCKEIREQGGLKVLVEKSSARSAIQKMRDRKDK